MKKVSLLMVISVILCLALLAGGCQPAVQDALVPMDSDAAQQSAEQRQVSVPKIDVPEGYVMDPALQYISGAMVPADSLSPNMVGENGELLYKVKAGASASASATATPSAAQATPSANLPAGYNGGYLIRVNLKGQVVTAFAKDDSGNFTIPVRSMICSSGAGGKTPKGTFKTSDKYRWHLLNGGVYGQYCTRITGHILFHSVPFAAPRNDTLKWNMYNQLGSAVSAGCIRLRTIDAKWIYDNCRSGTTVEIVASGSWPGVPSRLSTGKVAAGTKWDPTDPDPKNPNRDETIPVETPTPKPTPTPEPSEEPTPVVTQTPPRRRPQRPRLLRRRRLPPRRPQRRRLPRLRRRSSLRHREILNYDGRSQPGKGWLLFFYLDQCAVQVWRIGVRNI